MRYASYFHRKKREGGKRESEREVTAMGCKELGNISDTSNSLRCLLVRCVRDIPQLLASRHGRRLSGWDTILGCNITYN